MADPTKTQPAWQKVARKALIPTLLVVLLLVWLWPSGDVATDRVVSPSDIHSTANDEGTESVNLTTTDDSVELERPQRAIPPIPLGRILEHDPFALSAEVSRELNPTEDPSEADLADQVSEWTDDMMETLKASKLNVVFQGDKGVSAILGDRVLHEGDELQPGVRIRKITATGLTLELADDFDPESTID